MGLFSLFPRPCNYPEHTGLSWGVGESTVKPVNAGNPDPIGSGQMARFQITNKSQ